MTCDVYVCARFFVRAASLFRLKHLAGSPHRSSGHRDYVLTGANGEVVFINICAQVQNIPVSCRRDPDAVRGNAYVELNPSEGQLCRSLGSSVHWSPIDDKNPELGVDLMYSGGDACADGKSASARIRVLCDRDHTMGVPEDYPVERDHSNPCSYTVTWPSLYGCPIRSSSSLTLYAVIILAIALVAVFRSGFCASISQSSGNHDDDFDTDSSASQVDHALALLSTHVTRLQVNYHDAPGSVFHRIQDLCRNMIARVSKRSRNDADLYDL